MVGRPKGDARTKVNVSHLRRENELYRVVEMLGGIINIQTKDVLDAHMSLIETLAQAGERTSAPVGTRTDKRTINLTFNNLESRGRVKQMKTSVATPTGVTRSVSIVYLPDITEEKLNTFLADLGRSFQPAPVIPFPARKIDERLDYGADPTPPVRSALPLQLLQMEEPGEDQERWSKNTARADQLFSYDDATVRDVLLTERTTLTQMYGTIVSKVLRARELHLSTMNAFDEHSPASNIISYEKRIVSISFFCSDLPLALYCAFVSPLFHHEDLSHFLATESGQQTPVKDLPTNLHTMLQIGRARARTRILDLLELLRSLGLVTPLEPSSSDSPWLRCDPNGEHPIAYDKASLDGWTPNTPTSAPIHWQFLSSASLYHWAVSETAPPFWQEMSLPSYKEALYYWELMRQACTISTIVTAPDAVLLQTANASVGRTLRRSVAWSSRYVLTWHQIQYLKRFIDFKNGGTPLHLDDEDSNKRLQQICWVVSAPEEAVREFYTANHGKILKELEKARRRTKEKSQEKTKEEQAREGLEAQLLLAKRAAEARAQREQDWDDLLQRAHPDNFSHAASVRVKQVQSRFLQSTSGKDSRKWETEIAAAVREGDTASKKVLKLHKKRATVPKLPSAPYVFETPPVATNPPEKSIEELLASQGPPLEPEALKRKKRKRKGKEEEVPGASQLFFESVP